MGIPDDWQQFAIPIALGAVLLAACGAGVRRTRRFLDGAQRAEAHVVDLEKRRQGFPGSRVKTVVYYPVVTFTTVNGEEVTTTTLTGSPIRTMLDAIVEVLYDPNDPARNPRINTTKGRGMAILGALGVAGAILVLIGVHTLISG